MNGLRWFIGISGVTSGISAALCLVRLCLDDWPVVLKYSKWEYALKVVAGTAWAIWAWILLQ